MTDNLSPHIDLGGYLAGTLKPDERVSFEEHLAKCSECRLALEELSGVAQHLDGVAPPFELPPGLEAKTFAAVERAAVQDQPLLDRFAGRQRAWVRRAGAAGLAVAAIVVALLVGMRIGSGTPGELELQTALTAPDGKRATVEVTGAGVGRIITFETEDLPILPKGDFYELWFVGAGDTRSNPNRISAGTFHPDEQGRAYVRFTAAVDPAKYPVLSVTKEPGDGDPQRTGPEVLRSRSESVDDG